MAQVIGGVFGLTLTAYVFFVDKFREENHGDDTLYDATAALLNRYYHILALIAGICGLTILFCVLGIIDLYNWMGIYPFLLNESVLLFLTGITAILTFGVMLLDPGKLDKELKKMKRGAEKYYQSEDLVQAGDFKAFLLSYNQLEKVIFQLAQACLDEKEPPSYYYKSQRPQIIQSLRILNHNEIINGPLLEEINELRMYRNGLVHGIDFQVTQEVCDRVAEIYQVLHCALEVFQREGRGFEKWNDALRDVYSLTH